MHHAVALIGVRDTRQGNLLLQLGRLSGVVDLPFIGGYVLLDLINYALMLFLLDNRDRRVLQTIAHLADGFSDFPGCNRLLIQVIVC